MAQTQISDVIVPAEFTAYLVENTVPCWNDLIETQVHIGSDAEEPNPEGGGGFNPRKKPKESMQALALEECSSLTERESTPFSAACSGCTLNHRRKSIAENRPPREHNRK